MESEVIGRKSVEITSPDRRDDVFWKGEVFNEVRSYGPNETVGLLSRKVRVDVNIADGNVAVDASK